MNNTAFQLAYSSIAGQLLTEDQLSDLLSTAMIFNTLNNVTGVLLYHERIFFQVLEGDKETVEKLYKKISADLRHKDLQLHWTTHTEERIFDEWSMGYMDYDCLGNIKKCKFDQLQSENFERKNSKNQQSRSELLELIKNNLTS